jgi:valyl-tRNA synthetase
MIKPAYQQPIDKATYDRTIQFFESLMKILHPFMPFITEEIWHLLKERNDGDDIIVAFMPVSADYDGKIIEAFGRASDIILGIRNLRKDKNIPNKEKLELLVKAGKGAECMMYPVIEKMGNIESVEVVNEKPDGAITFIVKSQ